ncbi:hypothetical protein BFJ66_g13329 [Fusarium oxysporum f. sp. cepae]|uniref:Uncharacterized protein n=1 Tax=Fusarium oxysporum f. sp. cepae TaxID=396571 RepID=A0A3L6MWM8_FUSOX|nr:hypothetical protein BFJ65_g15847 [Fusarium oxysporum f. sp. cepae]RKK36801.1 hypothetical protein BFJ66_g13329 [Fusarium oxysporum f. sp. cepae]
MQLRQNNKRLRTRYLQVETEIGELQEAKRTARADLRRADDVVDGLLAMQGLPLHIFNGLSEVSEILRSIQTKL